MGGWGERADGAGAPCGKASWGWAAEGAAAMYIKGRRVTAICVMDCSLKDKRECVVVSACANGTDLYGRE